MELIKNKFGNDALKKILQESGIKEDTEIIIFEDSPDELCLKFISAAAKTLNISEEEVMLAFGDYWVNEFASKKYRIVFAKYLSAKDFLMAMDKTHDWATQSMEGASPPRFEFEENNTHTLIMHYFSARKLDKILEGLINGVLRYFKEEGTVEKMMSNRDGAHCAYKITFNEQKYYGKQEN